MTREKALINQEALIDGTHVRNRVNEVVRFNGSLMKTLLYLRDNSPGDNPDKYRVLIEDLKNYEDGIRVLRQFAESKLRNFHQESILKDRGLRR